ncbi:TadE/TadG family type IV pilus assembly protein [Erwinia sp. 9145]|uniref:TadE/TadG family type IV pilus assembly protein n=1 Tax=Erwinia sp. 9145 TaxID=1500895 RepID=UPI000A8E96A2
MFMIKRRLRKVICGTTGALAPAFAVLLPVLLGMLSLGIDGSNAMSQRARLSTAMAEASMGVAAAGKTEMTAGESQETNALIDNYLRYYIPAMIGKPEINIVTSTDAENEYDLNSLNYHFAVRVNVPLLFRAIPGLNREVTLGISELKIRKFSSIATDYVFVMDFSDKQSGLQMDGLKRVVKQISHEVIDNNPDSRIAYIPFSVGVPVLLNETNERGGRKIACSILFVPTPEYAINYAFWADKNLITSSDWNARMYEMDRYRYQYYNEIVRTATPVIAETQMQQRWCKANSESGRTVGQYHHSCKTADEPYSDIFSEDSSKIIKEEYQKAFHAWSRHNALMTIMHQASADLDAMLEKMFTEEAIINLPLPWTPLRYYYRTFDNMCQSGGWSMNSGDMAHAQPKSWMIELTNDLQRLESLQTMTQAGKAQISSGLLRSVPVMAKGKNRRKVFILLHDGQHGGWDGVTQELLKEKNVCGKIKEGLIARAQTKDTTVDMYYISTSFSGENVAIWGRQCVGKERATTATSEKALIDILRSIISDETGHFAS